MSSSVDLMTFLAPYEDQGWSGGLPATPPEVAAAETQLGIQFSDEYRQFLLHCKYGGELHGTIGSYFRLYGIEDLCALNPDPVWNHHLIGALFFATDDGEQILYFDVENRIGRGAWAVYLCDMGATFFETSIYVGQNMKEFAERVLTGEDIDSGPWLEEEGFVFDESSGRVS